MSSEWPAKSHRKAVATANPLRGISFDAAQVKALLDSLEGPIVLVGHSYGGAATRRAS